MRVRSAAIALMMLGLVAACGGSGGSGSGGSGSGGSGTSGGSGQPAGSIKVAMTEFKYTPSTIDAKAGNVVLDLVNNGTTAHDMVVDDPSGKQVAKSDLVQPGDSSTFTVANLQAGSYTVFCDLPGHRQAGMQGTLSVS